MITSLFSPAVCVIDDEKDDYEPIITALKALNIGWTHNLGNDLAKLPTEPLDGLKVVILDLNLRGADPRTSIAHTVKVFQSFVPLDTTPLVVVVWSKYAQKKSDEDPSVPPDDQPTLKDSFINTLLETEPKFKDKILFVVMPKPNRTDRPSTDVFIDELKKGIETCIEQYPAFGYLLSWESVLKKTGENVCKDITEISAKTNPGYLHDSMTTILRALANEQGGPECTPITAHQHLSNVLTQIVIDKLECDNAIDELSAHGKWLAEKGKVGQDVSLQINAMINTAELLSPVKPFVPGTVYRFNDLAGFKELFGVDPGELMEKCYKGKEGAKKAWWEKAKPILLEISPACDFAQNNRKNALLIGGFILPLSQIKNTHDRDAFHILTPFTLRWPTDDFKEKEVFLVFCSRYKTTRPISIMPDWLIPWFRLRDLPTASIRNWHSSQAARIGYFSLKWK